MLFSSTEYLLVFLPAVFGAYFLLNRLRSQVAAKFLLIIASIGFYAWWSVPDLGLLAASVLFNFAIGIRLARSPRNARSSCQLLALAIVVNLAVLGCFKYADFAVMNANLLLGTTIELPGIALPLAVSFFTFTQIAYLVDSYRGEAKEYSLGNYLLFVTFFPHLIAGPILHHAEMMPQFESRRNFVLRYSNVAFGLLLISVGLFKKVVLADTFAVWATAGFDIAGRRGVSGAVRGRLRAQCAFGCAGRRCRYRHRCMAEKRLRSGQGGGLQGDPPGIEDGTVTVAAHGHPYEVTTFRRDVETDGRRAVVAFSDRIEEDAARRDFTMNALYARADGTVIDPLGGLPDLLARRLRFVGDPGARIREDYLRILRFFRFHAWYGDPQEGLDPEGLAACAELSAGIETLSREREACGSSR